MQHAQVVQHFNRKLQFYYIVLIISVISNRKKEGYLWISEAAEWSHVKETGNSASVQGVVSVSTLFNLHDVLTDALVFVPVSSFKKLQLRFLCSDLQIKWWLWDDDNKTKTENHCQTVAATMSARRSMCRWCSCSSQKRKHLICVVT